MSRPLVEICVGDLAGALAAEAAGADRVELCADLGQGGTTPGPGTIAVALRRMTRAGLRVMVRPRGGRFVYSGAEVESMLADIAAIRAVPNPHGLELGVVTGALTADRRLDRTAMERLVAAAGPLPVTLHKAVDEALDQRAALDEAVELGIDRVLTSGGAATALDGAQRIRDLHVHAAGRLALVVAGGIRPYNVAAVLRATGAREVHLRAPGRAHGADSTDPALVTEVVRRVGS